MSSDTLVIGKNSALATAFKRHLINCNNLNKYEFITHDELSSFKNFSDKKNIINFAINPLYTTNNYDERIDFDFTAAKIAKKYNLHYFFISSRSVYSKLSSLDAKEESALKDISSTNTCKYSCNKIITENLLQDLLVNNVTILRVANIINYDYNRKRFKPTFMSTLLQQLKLNNKIYLDCSLNTIKDFITDDFFAYALSMIVENKPGIILNLGSGIAFKLGEIISWIVSGYGKTVEINVSCEKTKDEFFLNTTKLNNILDMPHNKKSVENKCIDIGRKLAHE